MIYVDPLVVWGGSNAPRCFRFKLSCHMYADDVRELHRLAKKIGLKRDWFQDARLKHYDLTENKRKLAMKHGAKEKSFRHMVKYMRKIRKVSKKEKDK